MPENDIIRLFELRLLAVDEGAAARANGKAPDDNPYSQDSDSLRHEGWNSGWKSGDFPWGHRCPVCHTRWVDDGIQDTPPEYCTAYYFPWFPEDAPPDEETDMRSPWKRGWDDCARGEIAPPYPDEDRTSIEEWLDGWNQAQGCGWHDPDIAHFRWGMDACFRGLPRDENKNLNWINGWDHENKTHAMLSAKRERDAACVDELTVTGRLAFLGRAFQAGNRSALLEAIKLCDERCFPPPAWAVAATASILEEVDAQTVTYRNRVKYLTRFLALASILLKDSPAQWQALTGASVSLKEHEELLSDWGLLTSYSNKTLALATQAVNRLGDIVDTQSVAKTYAKVRRDIEKNGRESAYIKGIDVGAIVVLFGHVDAVSEADALAYDGDFIPFRTDILP